MALNPEDSPFVSVITVVRNGASTLANTLSSVRVQVYPNVEHLIIDGASTDATSDIVRSLEHPGLRFISEPDLGIYDAMNKGVARARGEWLLFLGADDVLVDSAVLADLFATPPPPDCVALVGHSRLLDGRLLPAYLGSRTLVFNTLHHQAVLYRRSMFDRFQYRTDVPVIADYELNLLIYMQRLHTVRVNRLISLCGHLGISQRAGLLATQHDYYRIRAIYIPYLINMFLTATGIGNALLTFFFRRRTSGCSSAEGKGSIS